MKPEDIRDTRIEAVVFCLQKMDKLGLRTVPWMDRAELTPEENSRQRLEIDGRLAGLMVDMLEGRAEP